MPTYINPAEKGTRREIILRNGHEEFEGWRGMNLASTPSAVRLGELRFAVNVELRDGDVVPRRGITKFSTAAVVENAKFNVIDDFQTDPYRLYFVTAGCLGVAGTGYTINWYDQEQSPAIQRGVYYDMSSDEIILGNLDGHPFFGIGDQLRILKIIVPRFGEESVDLTGNRQDEPLVTYDGFVIRTLGNHKNSLMVGLDAGAGASKIGTWDGLTARDDLTMVDPPTASGKFRDLFVVGFDEASDEIRIRANDGTWSTLAPTAGGTIQSFRMRSYKDILYIAPGVGAADSDSLWSFDETNLVIAHTIAGATIYSVEEDGTYLYVGYMSATNKPTIARYDGSSWTDVHKDLSTLYSPTYDVRTVEDMRWHRGFLYAGGNGPAGGFIARSAKLDTSGTWTSIQNPTASSVLFKSFMVL